MNFFIVIDAVFSYEAVCLRAARRQTGDAEGEGINDHTEIQKARIGGYIGDIGHLAFIDRCNPKVSLYESFMYPFGD